MNTTTSPINSKRTDSGSFPAPKVIWGAIFAGIVATMAVQTLLMMLGAGLGLAAFNPATDGDGVKAFGMGAAAIQGIAAILSLWVGGCIAGRFLGSAGAGTGRLHGFIVWCAATVIAVILLSTGAGWVMGGLGKTVGGGLAMAGQPALNGMAEMVKEAADNNKTMFSSFTDEATSEAPGVKNSADSIRSKRELSYAIALYLRQRFHAG